MKKLASIITGLAIAAMTFLAPTAVYAATPEPAPTVAPLTANLTVVGPAAPEPVAVPMTGEYEYICQMPDGNSWSLQVGEPTTDCHGSYLQKYINGSMVANYHLAYGGGAAQVPPWNTGCVLAVASGVALFVFPPTGATAWVVVGGLTAAGLYVSCVA
ncbi:hypothetical protein [Agromyces larvae]|uniref:Secreted protein n=1 Tax=Agromyces larvae TaxID=2929802 RepID=A0ABY4BVC5_9MICO|nr:hypothetical protein [Agromyces larvae]UOE43167.1 hypothetical protein MTO99_13345 [Agromyces larvae]